MGERPEKPEGEMPEGMEPPEGMEMDGRPEMPEGWEPGEMPEGMELPEDFDPSQIPEGGFDGKGQFSAQPGEANTSFFLQDKVNFFSGLTNV